jgi:hypothetical protein
VWCVLDTLLHSVGITSRHVCDRHEEDLNVMTEDGVYPRPWCYDRPFDYVRANWDRHDSICESLPFFWPGHTGGVSCPSDLESCVDCDTMFFLEGVVNINYTSPEDDPLYLCGCCARNKGYVIKVSEHGVGI